MPTLFFIYLISTFPVFAPRGACINIHLSDIFLLQHVFPYRGKDSQGEEVIKPYTPTTLDSDVGHFELVIKVYIP